MVQNRQTYKPPDKTDKQALEQLEFSFLSLESI